MDAVLRLQMLPAFGLADECENSNVSCSSQASCRSESSCTSIVSGPPDTQFWGQ